MKEIKHEEEVQIAIVVLLFLTILLLTIAPFNGTILLFRLISAPFLGWAFGWNICKLVFEY